MGEPARKTGPAPAGPGPDARTRRDALRQRLADQGITLHVPPVGAEWHPPQPLPFSADELSDAVIRMRRGDL